jgi:poly(glycerol-phosphate) alpha-glucosyltransferase
MIKSANLTESVSRKGGGLFEAVLRLVQAHDRLKYDERVYGLWDEFSEADLPAWNPVPAAAFRRTGLRAIGYSPQFLKALRDFSPDLCHTHGLWLYASLAVKQYSQKKRQPYLISPHGMLDPWALKNSRWKKWLAWHWFEQGHLRGARCLRALCDSEAESIRQLRLPNDIVVIPNGIDLPKVPPTVPAPWGDLVEPGKKVLLFLSRIHPKKGLANLLEGWAEIQQSLARNPACADWVLAIAGWDQGGHEAELKRMATALGLNWVDLRQVDEKDKKGVGNEGDQNTSLLNLPPANARSATFSLIFLGPQFKAGKAACYHYCDAFILPSFSEGLPMVVLEAWANAKPVLMTAECNLPEGFQAGTAIKIEPSARSVADGLNELCRMTAMQRGAMGERAKALVESRFTWSRVGKQMEDLYAWVLGGGAKPGFVCASK